MADAGRDDGSEVRERLDELRRVVALQRADIDLLLARADWSEVRADASQVRADRSHRRADATEARADASAVRIEDLESHVDLDRNLILELQSAGSLNQEQVVQLQQALHSSRQVSMAIGIVMARFVVDAEAAFSILRRASNDQNRKLRELAEDVVVTGDTSGLRSEKALTNLGPHPSQQSRLRDN